MNIQAHKLNLIGTLLDMNDAKMLARVETFINAELSAAREREIVPMTLEEYNAEIDRALEAVREGRTISQAEMEKKISGWR